jgi:hypothetical protein
VLCFIPGKLRRYPDSYYRNKTQHRKLRRYLDSYCRNKTQHRKLRRYLDSYRRNKTQHRKLRRYLDSYCRNNLPKIPILYNSLVMLIPIIVGFWGFLKRKLTILGILNSWTIVSNISIKYSSMQHVV